MDGNGTLSCDEFIIMAVHLQRIGNDEHLHEAFNVFDKNQSGYIEFEELEQALLHDNLHPHLIQNIMVEIDKDKVPFPFHSSPPLLTFSLTTINV